MKRISDDFGVSILLLLGDLLALALSLVLAVLLRESLGDIFGFGSVWQATKLGTPFSLGLLIFPFLAWHFGLYPGYGLTPAQELGKQVTTALYSGFVFISITVIVSKSLPIPRSVLIITVIISMFFLPLTRYLLKRLLLRFNLWGRNVVILGAGVVGQRIAKVLQSSRLDGLHPIAFFDDNSAIVGKEIAGLTVVGTLDEAAAFARKEQVEHAIVAMPSIPAKKLSPLVKRQSRAYKYVQFILDLGDLPAEDVKPGNLDGSLTLEVRTGLYSSRNRWFKRGIDLFGVLLGSLLISPLLIAIVIAILIDSPGPLIFGHERIGRNGRKFKVWKFRTMIPNAQEVLAEYLDKNPDLRVEWEKNHKLANDPRITRLGKILRKLSLDELPQLWNIFLGQMSFVGPRPIVEAEIEKYGEVFELYKLVLPGLTGMWQVSGRSGTDYDERVNFDRYYVHNWSLWLDIIILIKTPVVVIKGRGAY